MVAIELGKNNEMRLDQLAKASGQEIAAFARQILMDYLDFHSLPRDAEEDWAKASVALAPQVMEKDNWDEADYGS